MPVSSPDPMRRAIVVAAAGLMLCGPATGEEIVASLEQGTNIAVALSPDHETLIVDLLGQLWSLPVTGGAARPLLPPEELARNPRISPDGARVVYQQYSHGQWDLWVMDLDTASRRRLTGPPFDEREPDFSDDGRSVVFVSDRDGASGLYRLRLATDAVTALPRAGGRVSWPSVSERGEIAYVEELGALWALRLLRLDGPPVTLVTSTNRLRAPSWRPGGGVILFAEQNGESTSDLRMVVLSDEPVIKTLTRGEDVFGFRPAWHSPAEFFYTADGRIWRRTLGSVTRRVVPMFAGIAAERAPADLETSVVPAAGEHTVQGIRGLSMSPDGKRAAFTALGDLWLVTGDGDPRRLIDDAFVDIDPAFTPDGKQLIFASDRAGSMDLWQLTLESGELERLTTGPAKAFAPAVSGDGRRVAYLETAGLGPWAPSELRVLRLAEPRRSDTLARDLYDASDVAWDSDDRSVSVWARDTDDPTRRSDGRARYAVDVGERTGYWDRETSAPGRALLPDAQLDGPSWSLPSTPAKPYVIQVDRLFDGVGTQYRRHMDIHVDGSRITAVVARGLEPLPETVIDVRDYTALPGLIEVQARHSALAGERLGRAWLAFGVTTVREVGGQRDDALERREAWASGRRLGPRLLVSGRHDEASGWRRNGEPVRPLYDVLEIYAGQPAQLRDGLLDTARHFGIPVFSDALFPAIRLGINALEHTGTGSGPYDLARSPSGRSYADVMQLLAQTGAAIIPGVAASGGFAALDAGRSSWSEDSALRRLFSAAERAAWRADGATGNIDGLEHTVAALVRAGARVAPGSDAPRVPYGLGLHAELSLLVDAGLPPDQALRLATSEAALTLGLEREVGTIEAGKLADLVIVDGNPLTAIRDSRAIVAVVINGVWYDREALLEPR